MKKMMNYIIIVAVLLFGLNLLMSTRENPNPYLDFDDEDFPELVNLKG